MRLALNLGYWSGTPDPAGDLALARAADDAGYDSVWVAESYGSDAVSILGAIAVSTQHIGIGSAVLQIPARSAAMTAMSAVTLDHLSSGRFRLGLGVSGPQVSEGWHGVGFDAPLGRTREYVDVVRMAVRRDEVRYAGRHVTLPLPGGPGKALRLNVRPHRPAIPLYLAAVGPKNLELAGEIADGWLGIFVSPERMGDQVASLARGRERVGRTLDGFDIVPTLPVVVHDDVETAAAAVKGYTALYVGGMGSREQNFYYRTACALGYEAEAALIQEHFLAGRHRDAAAAVPTALVDETALIGPIERITERMDRYRRGGVTTLSISPYAETVDQRIAVLRALVTSL